ncbi:hypothetical protein [Flavobacterium seoulense]|uniref:Uncharacterized protein n=1 Tax=Flavobacterium seoulense TaxID=1492738 RepID=A0A066WXN3_9FLAO|nr:hypothetical protein [Flavobacterium seoulense]KDN55709.1 hypothetical protein FEM21_13110 [Flavobacterium seoulense]
MKNNKIRIQVFLVFFLCFFKSFGQEKKVAKLKITKINYSIDFIKKVDCNSFDKNFPKAKTYCINSKDKIDSIQQILNKIGVMKYDYNSVYEVDTRGKLVVFYSNNSSDTICISLAALRFDNRIITDRKMIDYIIKL